MTNPRLQALSKAGVSVWLDDLSRQRIDSGDLAALAREHSVVGVTTNPTIFAGAIGAGVGYGDQIAEIAAAGGDAAAAIKAMTTEDVRRACGVRAPQYEQGGHVDGRVSIEVDPTLAADTAQTIAQAAELWSIVDRPNLMIKIPATVEGLPAITATIAAGIPVNVTLLFSVERYRAVLDAYLTGLEQALDNGHDIAEIHSVASLFVSRVDSEIDARLATIGTEEALALRGKAGLANSRLAYAAFEEVTASERWQSLGARGANPQRLLWASPGVKDPAYPDTMYVTGLVVADTVNTMPEKTLFAYADHGEEPVDTVTGTAAASQEVFDALAAVGVDTADVFALLEREGVEKFEVSWSELVDTVTAAPAKA